MMAARIDRPNRRHLQVIPAGDPTPASDRADGNYRKREVEPRVLKSDELRELNKKHRTELPEAIGGYPRPKTRGDCEPCSECQSARDHGLLPVYHERRILPCGHLVAEMPFRSRPCIFVGCRHHLYLELSVSREGLRFTFPDLEPEQLWQTCALDGADEGGVTLEEVGDAMNLTRERIRQIEERALKKLDRLDQRLGQKLRRMFE